MVVSVHNHESRLPEAGFLLVDKPQGVTSHDVVAAARRALHTRKVGHGGTLDPMATGLLVIGFGYSTRLLQYIVAKRKRYTATIRLGASTTTDDAEGSFLQSPQSDGCARKVQKLIENPDPINEGIAALTGTIKQVPSQFSAIKVNGKRSYDLARNGENIKLKPRPITVFSFDILRSNPVTNEDGLFYDLTVTIDCSAGTYIRALARDLGNFCEVGGYLTELRRVSIGEFDCSKAIKASLQIRQFTTKDGAEVTRNRAVLDSDQLASHIISVDSAIRAVMPVEIVQPEVANDLHYGRAIHLNLSKPTAIMCAFSDKAPTLCSIVEPGSNNEEAQPIAVFPQAYKM